MGMLYLANCLGVVLCEVAHRGEDIPPGGILLC
jgi:hypothetical protein